MPGTLDHLHPGVQPFVDEPADSRIRRLYMPKWVAYARGDEALARMEHLLAHPPCGRMPSMLLYGDSDIGKTMIVEKFVRDHPNLCNDFGEVETRKVLRLQMPTRPNDDKFYAQVIQGLGHQPSFIRRGREMEILGLRLLHQQPPKLMIVDEVHHLLAGSVREQRQALNQLKFLSNELRMSIVALGTSEALYAMQTDPQIASRFEPFALPRWRESAELRSFIVSFGRLLPLKKPSPFGDREIVQKLMAFSGGLTGKITTLLAQAAELAIRHRTESIDLKLLEEAAASGIYRLPAEQADEDSV